jgi:hypothetical protein
MAQDVGDLQMLGIGMEQARPGFAHGAMLSTVRGHEQAHRSGCQTFGRTQSMKQWNNLSLTCST